MNIEPELGEGDASAIVDVNVMGTREAGLAAGPCGDGRIRPLGRAVRFAQKAESRVLRHAAGTICVAAGLAVWFAGVSPANARWPSGTVFCRREILPMRAGSGNSLPLPFLF